MTITVGVTYIYVHTVPINIRSLLLPLGILVIFGHVLAPCTVLEISTNFIPLHTYTPAPTAAVSTLAMQLPEVVTGQNKSPHLLTFSLTPLLLLFSFVEDKMLHIAQKQVAYQIRNTSVWWTENIENKHEYKP